MEPLPDPQGRGTPLPGPQLSGRTRSLEFVPPKRSVGSQKSEVRRKAASASILTPDS